MSLDNEIQKLSNLIKQDDYLKAINLAKEIEEKIFDGDLETNLKKKEQTDYDYFMLSEEAKLIFWDEKLYERCLDNIRRIKKHQCSYKDSDRESWFFEEDDSTMITPIHRFIIDVPIKRLLLAILEVEVLNKYCSEDLGFITIDNLITEYRSICTTNFKFPFPYKDRTCHNYGNTIFNPNLKHFILFTKSLNSDEEFKNLGVEPLKLREGYEAVDVKFSFALISRIEGECFEMIIGLNADAKLSGLPDLILNSILKDISVNGPHRLIGLMKDKTLDAEYESIYQQKKAKYDRLLSYFDN